MAYFFDNTNQVRIKCIDLSDNSIYQDITLFAFSYPEPKDEDKEYENINNEIINDHIGIRMHFKIVFTNRLDTNNQENILTLIDCINKVKSGLYRFRIYPSWDSSMIVSSLDVFDCVMDGLYSTEKLHQYLSLGNNITIKFKEYLPNTTYVPKIPLVDDSSVVVPPTQPIV